MKVIAFSLSHFRHFLRDSKEPSETVGSHQLTFPNFDLEKEHVAPDFSEGSWRGCLVLMVHSWRMPIRIAFWRLDKFVFSPKSSNSLVQQGRTELPNLHSCNVSLTYVPMSRRTVFLTRLVVSVGLFGVIYSVDALTGIHTSNTLLSMGQELLKKVLGEIGNFPFPLGLQD